MKRKMVLRYIKSYEIEKRIGLVTYKLILPSHLTKIHHVFQVPLKIEEDLMLKLKPIRILDQSQKVLRNKKVLMVKVL
jgi:hypothetical protein